VNATPQDDSGSCDYDLDAQFRIAAVDDRWTRFALANHAPELASPTLIGHSLILQFSDRTTAHLYEQLLTKVQRTGRPIVVPIRCDSPTLRRYIDLHIEPGPHGGIHIRSRIVRVEARAEVRLLDDAIPRSGEAVRMCSFCKRIDVSGEWHEVEEATLALHLLERDTLPPVTHGVCPACYERAMSLLAD
jgi:hypothetical protein